MKAIRRALDATLGRWLRHLTFVLVRPFFSLFYNVSVSNKHLLQDLPGGLILASHVSRLDGPLVSAMLYSTRRVRPAAHYDEVYNLWQFVPMLLVGAVPMSSPKRWAPERRATQKAWSLDVLRRIIGNGGFVLLFPAGMTRQQPQEVIRPHFSGAYETLKAIPDCPVVLLRIQGIGRFDKPSYDLFWSFLFGLRGRRHVNMSIEILEGGLDTSVPLAEFNADLEARFNAPPHWPLRPDAEEIAVRLAKEAGASS